MKNLLKIWLFLQLLIPWASANAKQFEVHLLIVRRGQANQPVADLKIRAVRFGSSVIQGQIPGRSDKDGKAIIRFDSPMDKVDMLYQVMDHPSGAKWYVRFHGFFPNGNPDLPPHSANASPVRNPILKLEAYPESELASVALKDLEEGRTGMVGAAVADAIVIPQLGSTPPGGIKLNDPLRSYESVAKTLHTSHSKAKNLIQKWQDILDTKTGAEKLDERSLSALLKGDIGKASGFVKEANSLSQSEKEKLVATPNTGILIETIYQLNIAAQDRKTAPPNIAAETELKRLEQSLKPLRPVPKGRFPASTFDASQLENFTKTARKNATFK